MSESDDSQGKERTRSVWHAQRLTELILAVGLIGVAVTLIWIAWPRLRETFAPDEFAIIRDLARDEHFNDDSLSKNSNRHVFDCTVLSEGLETLVERGEELWSDGVFRVVRLQLESTHVGETARLFAFKHVVRAPSHHVAAGSRHRRPALPEHLRRPAHFLNESEHSQLMEKYDELASNSRRGAPVKNHEQHAPPRSLSFGRRIVRHRGGAFSDDSAERRIADESPEHHARAHGGGGGARGADDGEDAAPPKPMRRRRPNHRGDDADFDDAEEADPAVPVARRRHRGSRQLLSLTFEQNAVQQAAIEALIHEAKLLEQVARGHPNLPWYRGGCYDSEKSNVIGSVFEMAPFVGKQDQLMHFLQTDGVPWCAKVSVAVQLMFLVQYLSRPSVTRLCSLLPSHLTVSGRGRLLLHNVDEVLGANLDADTRDSATGELHCDAGVKFGRPTDEPRGTHVAAYIAGSVLRMMARRDDELKPFLSPIATRLLHKSFVRREKLVDATEELVAAYNDAAGPTCRREWLAELDALAEAELSEDTEDDDFQDSSSEEEEKESVGKEADD